MKFKKLTETLGVILLTATVLTGCSSVSGKEENDNKLSDNIIITETGEILEKEPQPTAESTAEPTEAPAPSAEITEVKEPEQEQVITEEDQTEPAGNELQIVFLGDSIFDNSRDGTGVPYLTSVQCGADVYNLAIAGTSASIEIDDQYENEKWTSRSLVGVVKAIQGDIPTDIFNGDRAKALLDNPKIDFSKTDYFVVEYGINDFLRAAPLRNTDNDYDLRTYVGALRYAVSNLREVAPDATIILCGPHYTQFFHEGRFIGDANTFNTGYGTLFDYKGICEYVANESQTEFFDAYSDLGINGYTAEQYLEDGVHLTAEGRQLYADALAKIILRVEETKNN